MRKWFVFLAIIILSFDVNAAPSPLTLGGSISLPSIGVRFRGFRDMRPMPLPMPAILATRQSDGAKLVSNLEYWRFRQSAGIWVNETSAIYLGEVLFLPIEKVELKPEKELAVEFKNIEIKPTDAQQKKWVQNFTNSEVKSVMPFPQSLYGCSATIFELEDGQNTRKIAYLLVPKDEPMRMVLFYFIIEDSQFDDRAERVIRQTLGSVQFSRPKAATISLSEKIRVKKSPEFEASRSRVIQSIQNFRDWWHDQSDNYIFVSNQTDRRAMSRLRDELERARTVFEQYFPLRHELSSVSVVRIFNKREQYLEYVGEEMKWSGGLWHPARRELVISPLDPKVRESLQKIIMRQVAFHEGFHQYLFFAAGEAQSSMWFNEGTAQYFEGIKFQSGKGTVSLPDDKERVVTSLFDHDKVYDIESLVNMDRAAFYGSNRDVNYLLAYALVYYLWKGAPVAGKVEYSQIPVRYYDTLIAAKDPVKANAAAWAGVDMKQFAKDLSRFWNSSNLIRESNRYAVPPTP